MEKYSDKFYYDETSPSFIRWKTDRFNGKGKSKRVICKDDVAGYVGRDEPVLGTVRERYRVSHGGKAVFVHNIIWTLFHGEYDSENWVIDHIDGNPMNNNISNLRLVTRKINSRNKKTSSKNTSGTTGVYWIDKTLGNLYAVAYWTDLSGNRKSKSFQVTRYGLLEAYCLAKIARECAINNLNKDNAGYTERHQYGI